MDISYLDDRYWNREHLLQNYPELSPVDAISIVDALAAIKNIAFKTEVRRNLPSDLVLNNLTFIKGNENNLKNLH